MQTYYAKDWGGRRVGAGVGMKTKEETYSARNLWAGGWKGEWVRAWE